MTLPLLLVLLFVALTICVWTVLRLSSLGYGRYQSGFTNRAEDSFEQLFLFIDSRKLFLSNVGLLLVLPLTVYFVTGSFLYVALVVIGIFVFPKYLLKTLEAKRRAAINAALPDALAQVAGAMRAGATFLNAVDSMVNETSGPISQEFSLMLREQRMGLTLSDALENVAERVQTEEMPRRSRVSWAAISPRYSNACPSPCAARWRWKAKSMPSPHRAKCKVGWWACCRSLSFWR